MPRRVLILSLILFAALTTAILVRAGWLVATTIPGLASSKGLGQFNIPTETNNPPTAPLATPVFRPDMGVGGVPQSAGANVSLPTIPPWPTWQHTPTSMASPAQLDRAVPTLEPPQHLAVNGIPWENIIVMPPSVVDHAKKIYAVGKALGRNPKAYSKVGDSTIENPHFMARFDLGDYNLGAYAHLEPAVRQFHGSHSRESIAVAIGLHSWSANDPLWADPGLCLPNETPVQCELRIHNPAILLIRLGTNDVGVGYGFDANIRQIVDTALKAGVIPVIGTKGDRHEGSNENNDILRRIAADFNIPLWDYDRVADTLPGRGLDIDATHMMTYYAHDYTDPTAFTRGHAMHNLTALMVLDALWRDVLDE